MTCSVEGKTVDSQSHPLTSADHARDARHALDVARDRMEAALNHIDASLAAAKYLGGNAEAMRQLSIVRTQLQTADLWANSAQDCLPPLAEITK